MARRDPQKGDKRRQTCATMDRLFLGGGVINSRFVVLRSSVVDFRGAGRLLDGYPELAFKEFEADGTPIGWIGKGLCYYQLGRTVDAYNVWKDVLKGSQQTGHFILSVKHLMAQAPD